MIMKAIEVTNKEKFAATIRTIARENDLNLIESISSYCEDNEIDMEDVIPLLDKNMKAELRVCAVQHRMVPGEKPVNQLF